MITLRALAFLAFLTIWACAAHAQPGGRYRVSLQDNMITMTDRSTGRDLIRPNRRKVVHNTALDHTVRLVPHPTGFDLVINYTNRTSARTQLGAITIPGIRIGRVATYRDLRADAKTVSVDHQNRNYAGPGHNYPTHLYSPVYVVGDDTFMLGISLLYPVLELDHEATFMLTSPGSPFSDSGRNWEVDIWLRDDLDPGETREYTVAVRATDDPSEWIRTLVPYRDYFRSLYGGVQYDADRRPVSGIPMADPGAFREDNPLGFAWPENWRPDRRGWGPVLEYVRLRPQRRYQRTMLWAPSGLFRMNQQHNFPFQFTSHMLEYPRMRESLGEFRRVSQAGIELGLWWGQSTYIMREWDTPHREPLDPDNPEHVELALRELDLAVNELGATVIGLDAFGLEMSPADSYEWLRTMQRRHPHVKFITEASHADIYHAIAPTYAFVPFQSEIQTPKVMADFLLPGHETWASVSFFSMAHELGRPPTDAEKKAEIERITSMGYIAVVFDDYTLNRDYLAAKSWEFTIPPDLRDDGGDQDSTLTSQRPSQGGGPTGTGGSNDSPGTSKGSQNFGWKKTTSKTPTSIKPKVTVKSIRVRKSGKAPDDPAENDRSGAITAEEAEEARRRARKHIRPAWFIPPAAD